jgi:hypothetical protein
MDGPPWPRTHQLYDKFIKTIVFVALHSILGRKMQQKIAKMGKPCTKTSMELKHGKTSWYPFALATIDTPTQG